jgi:hypothetical protein
MKKSLAFASVALFGLAFTTGAVAAKDPATPGATATPAAKSGKESTTNAKYCVVDTVTGTRIQKKVCKTRIEWMAEGVDPLNP